LEGNLKATRPCGLRCCSVADVRFGPVLCQILRTPNLTWGPVRVKWVNPEPNVGPVHQGFSSGSEQVRTSTNRKFFSLDLDVNTVQNVNYSSRSSKAVTTRLVASSAVLTCSFRYALFREVPTGLSWQKTRKCLLGGNHSKRRVQV
jgi:hypothetical protein